MLVHLSQGVVSESGVGGGACRGRVYPGEESPKR